MRTILSILVCPAIALHTVAIAWLAGSAPDAAALLLPYAIGVFGVGLGLTIGAAWYDLRDGSQAADQAAPEHRHNRRQPTDRSFDHAAR